MSKFIKKQEKERGKAYELVREDRYNLSESK